MFANIKYGLLSRKSFIVQKRKKICEDFLNVLWKEGFILGYIVEKDRPSHLKIFLKYINGKPAIQRLNLISRPSRKIFYSLRQIWKVDTGNSCIIVSTNQGLKTLVDCKKMRIGGEPCIIII